MRVFLPLIGGHLDARPLILLSLAACQGGLTVLDVPDSQEAFAVVTHDVTNDRWFAQVEGSSPPLFDVDSEVEAFVFGTQFRLPKGDLKSSTGDVEEALPVPDGAYRLDNDSWVPSQPGPEYLAFRYQTEAPACPEVRPRFLGFVEGETPVVALLADNVGLVAITEGGVATLVQASGDSVLTSTLGTTLDAASAADNVVYIATQSALIRTTLASNFKDKQVMQASGPVIQLFEAKGRVFALTDSDGLLEYDDVGFVRQLALPPASTSDVRQLSLVENGAGVWLALGSTLYQLAADDWTEVESFGMPVTALAAFEEELIAFAGDVYRVSASGAQMIISDAGLDIRDAIVWGLAIVVGIRQPPAGPVEAVIFDLVENSSCIRETGNSLQPLVVSHRTGPTFAYDGRQFFGLYGWIFL